MSRWWRAYDEAVDDPKLIMLTDRQHRAWFNLCCITSQNSGVLPSVAAIAVKLRMKRDKAAMLVAELVALGLIDAEEGGDVTMHNWGGRQFQSDTSTERVKRFRKRSRSGPAAVTETAPDTDSETEADSETEQTPSLRSGERARASEKLQMDLKGPLPADWRPTDDDVQAARSIGLSEEEIAPNVAKFRDHYRAHGEQRVDWSAQWSLWCRRSVDARPPQLSTPAHTPSVGVPSVFVRQETPQWDAWTAHYGATRGRPPPVANCGWYFPSEWPPDAGPPQIAA